ncbi:hypothetical protein CC86DRAFT_413290 [Ophiobolus disseminans]|uniref:Actin-like ATPase domain-containing protein n=1 Tax=Ophiobolus disseminans TaxID=1469910 RepID=A0A6A6ZES6_9PLEO|nr:hypothetical protein CC86DRAFT_413290 [Ophiobolus disseminans]
MLTGIPETLRITGSLATLNLRISQAKLLLDETDATLELRSKLRVQLKALKDDKVITDNDDIIKRLLVEWFKFAREAHLGTEVSRPEFVICVPSAWSVNSYHRWYKAMDAAIRIVWTAHDDETPPDIFTVSEPDAAAAHRGECITVIDCGGATIELMTLEKLQNDPQRWKEVCKSSANTIEGDLINERVRKLVTVKLARYASYLEKPERGISIETTVESEIIRPFETDIKRSCEDPRCDPPQAFLVSELMHNAAQGPSTEGLRSLILGQNAPVNAKGQHIAHVAWIGQFSDSELIRSTGEILMNTWPKKPEYTYDKGTP